MARTETKEVKLKNEKANERSVETRRVLEGKEPDPRAYMRHGCL